MKQLALGLGAVALAAGTATAGGVDRTNLNISPLFEDGNYAELSFASINPEVSGTVGIPAFEVTQSARDFTAFSFAYKHQFSDAFSFALIVDQPYGADILYTDGPPGLPGGLATVNSRALTALGRYEFGGGFSVHGGLRAEKITGTIVSGNGFINAEGDYDIGGVVGVAYEKPEIALRVALTYYTEIDHSLTGIHAVNPLDIPGTAVPTVATITMPERFNLDFQTGIAENTLLFGSVSHALWGGASLDSTGGVNWVNFPSDSTAYSLGVGRRFSDKISGSVSFGYEEGAPTGTTFLAPTGTSKSIGLGVAYQATETVKISGGVRYTDFSDKNVLGVLFSGNAISAGVKIGVHF